MKTHKIEIGDRPSPVEKLATKRDIANFLQVTTRTIENWHSRGLPHYKFGARRIRYKLADVQAYLDERCKVVQG